MTVVRFICILLLTSLSTFSLAEDLSPAKRADIERLLSMTKALDLSQQMGVAAAQQISQMLQQVRPDIPQKVLDTLPEEIGAVFVEERDGLQELVVAIYHEHFSASDIRGMIDFYSTDLGKKTIAVMPVLMSQSMQAGQAWGQSLGPVIEARVKARLEKEGYAI